MEVWCWVWRGFGSQCLGVESFVSIQNHMPAGFPALLLTTHLGAFGGLVSLGGSTERAGSSTRLRCSLNVFRIWVFCLLNVLQGDLMLSLTSSISLASGTLPNFLICRLKVSGVEVLGFMLNSGSSACGVDSVRF